MFLASALEIYGKHDEAGDDAELDNQCSLEEIASHLLLAFGKICVGTVSCTVAVQGLHNTGDCSESSQNTARMYWRVVRHIVQYASQDNVVCELIERPILVSAKIVQVARERQCLRCSIDQAYAGDENIDIAVVVSTYLAHDIATSKHESRPWKESGELPALIMTLGRVS